jgi:hypothetical protein
MHKVALYFAALVGGGLLMAGCTSMERGPLHGAPAATVPEATVSIEARAVALATAAEPTPPLTVASAAVASASAVPAAPVASKAANLAKPVVSAQPAPAKRAALALSAATPVKAQTPTPTPTPTPTSALAPPSVKAAVAPPLDLKSLETRLKETKAIGVFTKLALKNQIDDLLARFRAFYQGQVKISLIELRRSFDMLVMKTLALLQDADPPLAGALATSRESIWGILSDRTKFATL